MKITPLHQAIDAHKHQTLITARERGERGLLEPRGLRSETYCWSPATQAEQRTLMGTRAHEGRAVLPCILHAHRWGDTCNAGCELLTADDQDQAEGTAAL